MSLGSRIRARREALAWPQERLAKGAGIKQTDVSRLELDKTPDPGVSLVARIARALYTTVEKLLADADFMQSALPALSHAEFGLLLTMDSAERGAAPTWEEVELYMRDQSGEPAEAPYGVLTPGDLRDAIQAELGPIAQTLETLTERIASALRALPSAETPRRRGGSKQSPS